MTPIMAQSVINLVLALLLGVVIGLERQLRKHPAGLHTNALVCMGSAAYVAPEALSDRFPRRHATSTLSAPAVLPPPTTPHGDP